MSVQDLLNQAKEIRPGDHLVALYQEENEIEGYITSYIYNSLSRNERCLYITGDADTSAVLDEVRLLSEPQAESGDLVIMGKTELYARDGKFSPDKLIHMIQSLARSALDDGYSALAITGEISWVLDYDDGEELIIEYEWKLNDYVFHQYPVSALCRYNITKFTDEMIRNIIQLHPIIIWQYKIHENPYYIPPEGFKHNSIAQHQVKSWLENIFNYTDTQRRFKTIVEKKQEEMRQLHDTMTNGLIMAFLNLLDTHDPYTKNHCTNVANLSHHLAARINRSDTFIAKLTYAALVHDIGKTLIPKTILNKPGRLTPDEFAVIKTHPIFGANALDEMEQLHEVSIAVRHHHEHYNGRGYPDGLSGEAIPLMARILALCDCYDAMTNDRPYRKARSHDDALQEIIACSGQQFDPVLVDHFIQLFPNQTAVNQLVSQNES